jgi:class 3 adenylate cyclase
MFYASDTILNPVLMRSSLDPIDFRICLDHGPITTAKVGAARGFNGIVAIGATANIASKMLSFADKNTILVGTMVLDGLPADWRKEFIILKTTDTGWQFSADGRPYAFWQYNGRWSGPLQ